MPLQGEKDNQGTLAWGRQAGCEELCFAGFQCAVQDRRTLELTKSVVREQYELVAVLERFDDGFAMLEDLLPTWFSGLTRTRLKAEAQRVTPDRREVSPEAVLALHRLCALDVEFYDYVAALFDARYKVWKQRQRGGARADYD